MPLVRYCQYMHLHAKNHQNIPRGLSDSYFYELIMDGQTRLDEAIYIKRSDIWQNWLGLANMYLHAKIIKMF